MGEEVEQRAFTREDRAKYRHKIRRSLDVFASLLRESRFEFERPLTGMEIELNLIDDKCDPAMRNAERVVSPSRMRAASVPEGRNSIAM